MRPSRSEVAKIGETFAAAHLKNKGYHILGAELPRVPRRNRLGGEGRAIHRFCGSENAPQPQVRTAARGSNTSQTATDFQNRFSLSTRAKFIRDSLPF